ncbi:hypothetical protein AGMMS49525_04980 [Bacteroidia bacterium]|nr:hypothetical protein AGMMS49525_04980 [Bacteroidia bacterium]
MLNIKVELEIECPQGYDVTEEQFLEWVKFELGFGSIKSENPLSDGTPLDEGIIDSEIGWI